MSTQQTGVIRYRSLEGIVYQAAIMMAIKILTHLGNSASEGGVSVFLVHVDCFGSGQVSEDDAVVLDDAGVLLVDLLN